MRAPVSMRAGGRPPLARSAASGLALLALPLACLAVAEARPWLADGLDGGDRPGPETPSPVGLATLRISDEGFSIVDRRTLSAGPVQGQAGIPGTSPEGPHSVGDLAETVARWRHRAGTPIDFGVVADPSVPALTVLRALEAVAPPGAQRWTLEGGEVRAAPQ